METPTLVAIAAVFAVLMLTTHFPANFINRVRLYTSRLRGRDGVDAKPRDPPVPAKIKTEHAHSKRVRLVLIRHAQSLSNSLSYKLMKHEKEGFVGFLLHFLKNVVFAVASEVHAIFFADHGTSEFVDMPLSPEGTHQAKSFQEELKKGEIGGALKDWKEKMKKTPLVVVTSNLRRAQQTTLLALDPGDTTQVIVDPNLQETCMSIDPVWHVSPRSAKLAHFHTLEQLCGYSQKMDDKCLDFNYATEMFTKQKEPELEVPEFVNIWSRQDNFVERLFSDCEHMGYFNFAQKQHQNPSSPLLKEKKKENNSDNKQNEKKKEKENQEEEEEEEEEEEANQKDGEDSGDDELNIPHAIVVGHGSWLRRFFKRYVNPKSNSKLLELAASSGFENRMAVSVDLELNEEGRPYFVDSSAKLLRGKFFELPKGWDKKK